MKIIFGLGNPEKHYQKTRHNTGCMALAWLAAKHQATWQAKPKLHAMQTQIELNGVSALLVIPTVNYNNNGFSVRKAKDFYNVENKDILVIHDELVLPFGTVRVRLKGSDAGNNGIKGVNAHIGEDYARIRVGIGHEGKKQGDIDYVLSTFTSFESTLLPDIFALVERLVNEFAADVLEPTSHTVEPPTK